MVPLIVFAALAIVFSFSLMTGDPSKVPSALIGKAAPQTAFPALPAADGSPATDLSGIEPSQLAGGRVSVVNFWASWCGPCVQEHPYLVQLGNERPDINLFGVNYKDSPANARRFLGRYGNPYTAVGTDTTGRSAIEWGVYGMPETFIVDGEGRIVFKHVGPIDESALRERILPAIDEAVSGSKSAAGTATQKRSLATTAG